MGTKRLNGFLLFLAGGGSVLSASIASSNCCEGFNVLALLRLTNSGQCLGLVQYRPWFAALSFALFAFTLFIGYRMKPNAIARRAAIFVGFLVVGFVTLPYYGNYVFGTQAKHHPPKLVISSTATAIETIELKVGGMECYGCAMGLQNQLGKINGVKSVEVGFHILSTKQ